MDSLLEYNPIGNASPAPVQPAPRRALHVRPGAAPVAPSQGSSTRLWNVFDDIIVADDPKRKEDEARLLRGLQKPPFEVSVRHTDQPTSNCTRVLDDILDSEVVSGSEVPPATAAVERLSLHTKQVKGVYIDTDVNREWELELHMLRESLFGSSDLPAGSESHRCIDEKTGKLRCQYKAYTRGTPAAEDGSLLMSGDVYMCAEYGVSHICTARSCNKRRINEGSMVCVITGRIYGNVESHFEVTDLRSKSEFNTYGFGGATRSSMFGDAQHKTVTARERSMRTLEEMQRQLDGITSGQSRQGAAGGGDEDIMPEDATSRRQKFHVLKLGHDAIMEPQSAKRALSALSMRRTIRARSVSPAVSQHLERMSIADGSDSNSPPTPPPPLPPHSRRSSTGDAVPAEGSSGSDSVGRKRRIMSSGDADDALAAAEAAVEATSRTNSGDSSTTSLRAQSYGDSVEYSECPSPPPKSTRQTRKKRAKKRSLHEVRSSNLSRSTSAIQMSNGVALVPPRSISTSIPTQNTTLLQRATSVPSFSELVGNRGNSSIITASPSPPLSSSTGASGIIADQGVPITFQVRGTLFTTQEIDEGPGLLVGTLSCTYKTSDDMIEQTAGKDSRQSMSAAIVGANEQHVQKCLRVSTAAAFCRPDECLDTSEVNMSSTTTSLIVISPVSEGGAPNDKDIMKFCYAVFNYLSEVETGRQREMQRELKLGGGGGGGTLSVPATTTSQMVEWARVRSSSGKGRTSSKKLTNIEFVRLIEGLFVRLRVDLNFLYGPEGQEYIPESFTVNMYRIKCLLHNRNHICLFSHAQNGSSLFLRDVFRIYEKHHIDKALDWITDQVGADDAHHHRRQNAWHSNVIGGIGNEEVRRMHTIRHHKSENKLHTAKEFVIKCLRSSRNYHMQRLFSAEPLQESQKALAAYVRECADRKQPVYTLDAWMRYISPMLAHSETLQKREIELIDYLLADPRRINPCADFIMFAWENLCTSPTYLVQSTHRGASNFNKHCIGCIYKMSEGVNIDVRLTLDQFEECGIERNFITEKLDSTQLYQQIQCVPKHSILERCLVHLTTLGTLGDRLESHYEYSAATIPITAQQQQSSAAGSTRQSNGSKSAAGSASPHSPSSVSATLRSGSRKGRHRLKSAQRTAAVAAAVVSGATSPTSRTMTPSSSPWSAAAAAAPTPQQHHHALRTAPAIEAERFKEGDISKKFCRTACQMVLRAYESEVDCARKILMRTLNHLVTKHNALRDTVRQNMEQMGQPSDTIMLHLGYMQAYKESQIITVVDSFWLYVKARLEHPWAQQQDDEGEHTM